MEIRGPYPEVIPAPEISASEFVLQNVSKVLNSSGDKVMVRDLSSGDTLRYSEVDPLSRRVGSALTKLGFKPQDTLIYVTSNCCKIYPILFGVWRLNGIIRPSYPEDTQETLKKRMTESDECRFVLCEASTAPYVLSVCGQLDWTVHVFCFDDVKDCLHVDVLFEDDGSAVPEKVTYNQDDIVAVLCTGGTTGPSKGAVFTHRRFMACMTLDRWTYMKISNGKIMSTIRVFHMGGVLLVPEMSGRGVETLLMSTTIPEVFLRGIHEHRPSAVCGFHIPMLWASSHPTAKNYDLTSVKTIGLGGATVTEAIMEAVRSGFPRLETIHRVYGLTEAFLICTTQDLGVETKDHEETPEFKGTPANSCGKLSPGVRLKIADVNTGEILGANMPGELLLQGPTIMTDYYKNPEASAQTIRDGWLHTGDYGYYDEDGFVYVLDRNKESFKYWNYHISPVELEDVIMKHPEVIEACVIGIPDPEGGDSIPRAYVTKVKGSHLDEDTLKHYVHCQVSSYKQLRGGVVFLDNLPKSHAGKMSRQMIRKMFLDGLL